VWLMKYRPTKKKNKKDATSKEPKQNHFGWGKKDRQGGQKTLYGEKGLNNLFSNLIGKKTGKLGG